MNDSDNLLKYNPFETLGKLLKDKAVLRPVPIKKQDIVLTGQYPKRDVPIKNRVTEPAEVCATSVNEESAFLEAMEGVKPMVRDKHHEKKNKVANPPDHLVNEPEQDVRQHLDNLLKYGEGFIISKTPEYMEGIGRRYPPGVC